jgi:hypothetical protein
MIPLPPLSVKFPDEERAQLKSIAATIGWPESRIVRDSVTHLLHLLRHPDATGEPKFLALARLALVGQEEKPALSKHPAKEARPKTTKPLSGSRMPLRK